MTVSTASGSRLAMASALLETRSSALRTLSTVASHTYSPLTMREKRQSMSAVYLPSTSPTPALIILAGEAARTAGSEKTASGPWVSIVTFMWLMMSGAPMETQPSMDGAVANTM